jgi:predicted RND superfamily exporter protein
MSPTSHRSISQRWAELIAGHPVAVLVVAVVAALGCTATALFELDINASRNDLIAEDLDFNQRFLEWWEYFPGTYDLIVVADTHGADGSDRTQEARRFIDALAQRLRDEPTVVQFDYGAPEGAFSPKTARLLPMEDFGEVLKSAQDARPLLESKTVAALLGRSVSALREGESEQDEDIDHTQGIDALAQLVRVVGDVLRGEDADDALSTLASSPHADSAQDWQYLTSPNGRFLFMRITPRIEDGSINALGDTIAAVRLHVDEVGDQFPGLEAGLTGVEVIEADETNAATRDATMASIVALVGIAVLLVISFRGVRTPIMLLATLVIGIAWSFGFLLLAIGYLQILSVIFVLVLLGLGIDFGIHFVSAVEAARAQDGNGKEPSDGAAAFVPPPSKGGGMRVGDASSANRSGGRSGSAALGSGALAHAFALAFRRSAPSISLGAISTALAFGTTALTDFRGVAELGIIAAGGIVLCLIATFTVLPALIRIAHPRIGEGSSSRSKPTSVLPTNLLIHVHKRPIVTLGAAGVFLAICAWYASHIQFDYDLMRLQPRGVESVEWQDKLLKEGGVSAWFAISIADDFETARARTAEFRSLDTVGEVAGIALLFPPDEDAKLDMIEVARRELQDALQAPLIDEVGPPFSAAAEAETLVSQLISLRAIFRPQGRRADLPTDIRRSMMQLGAGLDATIETATNLNPTTLNARVAALQEAYTELRRTTARKLGQLLSTDPLAPYDFPREILRPYIDITDPDEPRYAIEIHPDPPADVHNALDPRFLPEFVSDLESVDPDVTGVLMQIYHSGSLMVRSYLFAGALAIVLVIVLLTIWLRSLYDALLCIVPVAMGFGAVLAAMDVTEHTLNAANIIVLPLMFGIGVDSGVHVIHRFRQHPNDRPRGLAHGTGKGIIVTSLTTVIGFGAMLLARHRGIQSLGLVMALGILLTMLACLIVLPAWLELRARKIQ